MREGEKGLGSEAMCNRIPGHSRCLKAVEKGTCPHDEGRCTTSDSRIDQNLRMPDRVIMSTDRSVIYQTALVISTGVLRSSRVVNQNSGPTEKSPYFS